MIYVDQAKSFDRVDHHYLMCVLAHFGLGLGFFRWIIQLPDSIDSIVPVNGFLQVGQFQT